jgi:hypothetical protein
MLLKDSPFIRPKTLGGESNGGQIDETECRTAGVLVVIRSASQFGCSSVGTGAGFDWRVDD